MKTRKGRILWFVGLSGAGKSTLCMATQVALWRRGEFSIVLDGDDLRRGLSADLSFTKEDRKENIRRAAYVAELIANACTTVLVATISPLKEFREFSRSVLPDMLEIFVDAPLATCERRDPKGLYQVARRGELPDFTGLSSAFERPEDADLICFTDTESVEQSVDKVLAMLDSHDRKLD